METTGEVDERKMEDTPVKALRGNGPAVFVMGGLSRYTQFSGGADMNRNFCCADDGTRIFEI